MKLLFIRGHERPMNWPWRWVVCGCLLAARSMAQPSAPETTKDIESAQHGFPAMLDLQGRKLADGEFVQRLDNGLLRVTIDYDFGNGRRIEEKTALRQLPRLEQEQWSWTETRNGEMLRHFEVDFKSGKAAAEERKDHDVKRWSEDITVEPGRTFAGFGFVLALKTLRERLVHGEQIELHAVGWTPKPRVVSVELSCGGRDEMTMAGREVYGDRFTIHPRIPAIARVFVEVKDTHIWLTTPPSVSFLRWEGPLVEASDPVVRVDLLPGGRSGPAAPAGADRM